MRPAIIQGALREELWRRYKAGETILGIGRALGQRPTTIHRVLQATGGIGPPLRRRSARVLSFAEREEISRGIFCRTIVSRNCQEPAARRLYSEPGGVAAWRATALPCCRRGPYGVEFGTSSQDLPACPKPKAATDRRG